MYKYTDYRNVSKCNEIIAQKNWSKCSVCLFYIHRCISNLIYASVWESDIIKYMLSWILPSAGCKLKKKQQNWTFWISTYASIFKPLEGQLLISIIREVVSGQLPSSLHFLVLGSIFDKGIKPKGSLSRNPKLCLPCSTENTKKWTIRNPHSMFWEGKHA